MQHLPTTHGTQCKLSRRAVCLGLGVVLTQAQVGVGAETANSPDPTKTFKVIPLDFETESIPIAPPPPDDRAEARQLFEMRSLRTKARLQQIQQENENPIPFFLACAGISERASHRFLHRFYETISDVELVVLKLKERHNRKRPSLVMPEINPVVPVPWHASYPSGHATQSTLIAELLTRVAPKSAKPLQRLAIQVGRNREIAGLHYPSDTAAGMTLGKWLANQPFIRDDTGLHAL